MQIGKLFMIALTPCLLNAIMFAKHAPQQTSNETSDCRSPFHVMHADVRHTESKGVGYNKGYTTLEWFGIYDRNPNFMPFLDLRGHVFNDGKLAGNVGVGERTLMTSINHLLGLYLYYDVRQTHHSLTVNQLSPGIEILGKRMEYRINAYFPVSQAESRSYDHKFGKFEGHQMMIKSRKKYAMRGADAEVGAHITQSTHHDFYFGIGPYFFTDKPNCAWGGKSRLYWRYKDYVSLEASYSYDHLFKNVIQGTVAFSYPFGKKLHRKNKNCSSQSHDLTLSRAAFSPDRFEIPVVDTHHRSHVAKDPSTKQPITFWFVKNTSSSDGTYESPFPTLTQAQNASSPGDIIYLLPGDGTTKGMNSGIVLKDHQKLFGSATAQTVKTNVGHIQIPALTFQAPSLTNTTGSVIILANHNEVSGMNIQVLQTAAIDVSNPIAGSYIHNNQILGNVNHTGINIVGSGSVFVENNRITSSSVNTSTAAITITALDGKFMQANIARNTCTGYGNGIQLKPSSFLPAQTTTASCNATINENTIANFGDQGILVLKGMANSSFRITNNTIRDTVSSASPNAGILISINNPSDSGQYYINRNTVITSTPTTGTRSILFQTFLTPGVTSTQVVCENNTLITGAGPNPTGLEIIAGGNDIICTEIRNNLIQSQQTTTKGIVIDALFGRINISDFSNNLAPSINIEGNANFTPPNTCGL